VSGLDRKVLTCIKKGCDSCPWGTSIVPETCEYKILHVLETDHSKGFHQCPRRSGKTSDAVDYAVKCIEAGYAVAYIGHNRPEEAVSLEDLGVKVMTLKRARIHMRGLAPMFVITDDIEPGEVDVKMRGSMGRIFNTHLSSYWFLYIISLYMLFIKDGKF